MIKTSSPKVRILIVGCDYSILHTYWRSYATDVDREIWGFVYQTNDKPPITWFKGYKKSPIHVYPLKDLEKVILKHHIQKCILHVQNITMQEVQSIINRIIATGHCELEFVPHANPKIKSFKPLITVTSLAQRLGKTQVCRYFLYIISSKFQRRVSVIYPITELEYIPVPTEFSVNDGFLYRFNPGDTVPDDIFSDTDSWQIKLYLENGAHVYATTNVRKAIILAEQTSDFIIYDSRSCECPNISSTSNFCLASSSSLSNIRKFSLWPGLLNFHLSSNIIVVSKHKTTFSEEAKSLFYTLVNSSLHQIYFARSSYVLDENSVYDIFNQNVITVDHVENKGSAAQVANELGAYSTNNIVANFPRSASPTTMLGNTEKSEAEMNKIAESINQSDADVVIVSLEKDIKGVKGKQMKYTTPEIEDLDYAIFKHFVEQFSASRTPPLKAHFEAQVEILSSLANASKHELFVTNNSSSNREAFCRLFLQSHLPPCYRVTSGEIIDSSSNVSGQIDIIVVNDSSPTLTIDKSGSIISPTLADNVLAAVEVKTNLNVEQLRKSLSQLRPVKALMTNHETLENAGGEVIKDPLRGKILTGIFSFIPGPEIEKKVPEVVSLYPGVVDFIVLPEEFGFFSVSVLKVCGISVDDEDVARGYKLYTARGMGLAILFGILNALAAKRRFSGSASMKYLNGKWGDQSKLISEFELSPSTAYSQSVPNIAQIDIERQIQDYDTLVKNMEIS
ncbi:GTPase [Histomonas meleagridis]|uniref:GTPase n=1 Tax=Histomonas meleagridis TaxID=135588 RepID=UPI00355A6A31|nr:GTPase [Histomonas meleagridis]KAH0803603.1 GTPase [Histomonas meleagridis]